MTFFFFPPASWLSALRFSPLGVVGCALHNAASFKRAVAAIAAAAAPPGEAILARTDATGAGAGVEGAYEAEMMEALAACGD